MAAMGATLSDADLAAVFTYIRGSWGNQNGAVTADHIKAAGSHQRESAGGGRHAQVTRTRFPRTQNFFCPNTPVRGSIPAMLRKVQPNKVRAHGGRFAIVASATTPVTWMRCCGPPRRNCGAPRWRASRSSACRARTKFPSPPNTSRAWPILSTSTRRFRGDLRRRFAATAAACGDYLSGRDFAR